MNGKDKVMVGRKLERSVSVDKIGRTRQEERQGKLVTEGKRKESDI